MGSAQAGGSLDDYGSSKIGAAISGRGQIGGVSGWMIGGALLVVIAVVFLFTRTKKQTK
ncbi:MAG: hypothetical protein U1F65_05750 [Verrucomicrobiota bacterium]